MNYLELLKLAAPDTYVPVFDTPIKYTVQLTDDRKIYVSIDRR